MVGQKYWIYREGHEGIPLNITARKDHNRIDKMASNGRLDVQGFENHKFNFNEPDGKKEEKNSVTVIAHTLYFLNANCVTTSISWIFIPAE